MTELLSVQNALKQILQGVETTPNETVTLEQSAGRILSDDLMALRTQPPFAASAMDGYAVRGEDIAVISTDLTLIGESAAGHGFRSSIKQGECVRIFTGAPVPPGADTIIIQENVEANGNQIKIMQAEKPGRYIRPAGMDFSQGDVLLKRGHELNASTISLAASMNHPSLSVQRKPRVVIISSGDELLRPGSELGSIRLSHPIHLVLLKSLKTPAANQLILELLRILFLRWKTNLSRAMTPILL